MSSVAIYEKKVPGIVDEALALKITGDKEMATATELLSTLNKTLKAIETEEDKVLEPMKEVMKAEKARWSPFKDKLKPAIDALRKGLGAYQTEKTRIADEEAEKIAARVGKGKGKLKPETAMKQIDSVERPDAKVATDAGTVGFRTDQKLKIVDETLIPREYLVPDEKRILADLKDGKTVLGCKIEKVQTPINRTA